MIARIAAMAAVLVLALLVGTVVFPLLAIGGWRPDLVVLTVAAFAYIDGADTGARYGFAAGLAADLVTGGSHLLGVSALVLLGVGYTVGLARPYLAQTGLLGQVLVAATATALAVVGLGVVGIVLDLVPAEIVAVLQAAGAVAAYNALLAPFVFVFVGWITRRVPGRGAASTRASA